MVTMGSSVKLTTQFTLESLETPQLWGYEAHVDLLRALGT